MIRNNNDLFFCKIGGVIECSVVGEESTERAQSIKKVDASSVLK
jgi:hypothetical protein